MSRFIKVELNSGEIHDIGIQQYEVGLYVCIYKDGRMLDQFGLDITEDEFVQSLRDDKKIKVLN